MDADIISRQVQTHSAQNQSTLSSFCALEKMKKDLLSHRLYSAVNSIEALRVFMEAHVFAVWDFMSLAKRLQISLTHTTLPWFPPVDTEAARFINEIILNEESDLSPQGSPQSHLEMYREAMIEIDASTRVFDQFCFLLKQGATVECALEQAGAPKHVAEFVSATMTLAMQASIVEVASYFLYGREDPIPEMFKALMQRWGMQNSRLPKLCWYLDRHIQLDGDEHGPAAQKLLQQVTRGDPVKLHCAYQAAQHAIRSRIGLWDGILQDIHSVTVESTT